MTKRLCALAAAALAVLAAVMLQTHLYLPGGDEREILPSSRAEQRDGVRMAHGAPRGAVDVNHASASELDTLPGIGPAIAQRIVEERTQGGAFHYPEDLLSVRGIGQKTLEKLRSHICIH